MDTLYADWPLPQRGQKRAADALMNGDDMQDKVDEFKAALVQMLCTAASDNLGQTAKLLAVCDRIGATDHQRRMICGVGTRMLQYARKELSEAKRRHPKPLSLDTIMEACAYA